MNTAYFSFNSPAAALVVAEAYENALGIAIQLSRLQNDTESLMGYKDHLESVKNQHKRIADHKLGEGDWESLCKVELILIQFILEECVPKIQDLLS